jgi:hypothetical protein
VENQKLTTSISFFVFLSRTRRKKKNNQQNQKVELLTQEWMLKTIVNLGFGQRDAEVYVFLALNGIHTASDIAKAIGTYKRQVYRALKKLKDLKVVTGSKELPAHFSALPFDKLLDLLKKANLQEAKRIEQNKDSFLALWDSTVKDKLAS